ncbi:MAG: LPS-assembly protein LptD [Burkholderiales bacterium]|nr:LPS-assembly protein LptD [Burkholderiales bacterium]
MPLVLALASAYAPAADDTGPTVITADHIDGIDDTETHAEGKVVIERPGQTINADWVKLFRPTSEVHAGDHTHLEQNGDVMDGGELNMREDTRVGTLETVRYSMAPRMRRTVDPYSGTVAGMTHGGHGDAVRLIFEGPDKYRLQQARFTSCAVGDDDWYVRAPDMELDYTRDLGVAHQGVIEFKGVPILYAPYLDFSLDGARKSGFLAPTISYAGTRGLDLTVPFYWNIAPNMDATLAPRLMTKRGLLMNDEFRYLGQGYSGQVEADVISHDQIAGEQRHWYALQHKQDFGPGWHGELNMQQASDDRYFVDFGDRVAIASTQFLPRDGWLSYTQPGFNTKVDFSSFQTLQDPTAPVPLPYSREPQVTLNYNPLSTTGYRFDLTADAVTFRNGTPQQAGNCCREGTRYHAYPSLSWPIERAWGFFNPKIGFDMTSYNLSDGRHLSRDTMRSSIDSGLYFDRNVNLFGHDMVQSLEPRLYYVRIPYKDQSAFPVFDSGEADFSFAQMFSDNRFIGGDRLNDANQITAATTTRFFETESGIERGRFTIGQRFYITRPQVTLASTTTTGQSASDILAALGAQPAKDIWLDAGWDYDNHTKKSNAESLGVSYQPAPGKLFNFRYRLDNQSSNNIKQFDISTEWPLTSRWHGVARYNWSIIDHRVLEALAGVEYNGGCWVLRIVGQRYVTSTTTSSSAPFIQLELNDLGRLGTNPLQMLKDSIPGYTKLN